MVTDFYNYLVAFFYLAPAYYTYRKYKTYSNIKNIQQQYLYKIYVMNSRN